MELFCYQAECGDALRIRYEGNDGKLHNVFLDSGYERTFKHTLQSEINQIKNDGEYIDLWIISHIHDDHIGGAIKYIKSVRDKETIDITKSWFYNPPRKYPKEESNRNAISASMSIKQGDLLYDYLVDCNMLPEVDITTELKTQDLFGLKMQLLSPTKESLEKLRSKYKYVTLLETSEFDLISEATAAIGFDYNRELGSFDLESFEEDESIENECSIAVLFEYKNKKVLWLSDSHASTIVNSLRKNGYSIESPLKCEYVITSHHASKANNSVELFELLQCENYVITSNGENKYYLPSKEALARIIKNKNRCLNSRLHLFFTYNASVINKIFESDGDSIFDLLNFDVIISDKRFINFRI